MSASWTDTTAPSDMMDYGLGFDWLDIYETVRLNNL